MFEKLSEITFSYPCIDNHAHNILTKEKKDAFPLHCLAGEGVGEAADDLKYTVAFKRATKQLASLFGCEPTWDAVKSYREMLPYDELCRKCFEPTGIQSLLLDDLMIGIQGNCMDTPSHRPFIHGPVKRIIRLESVAEELFTDPELLERLRDLVDHDQLTKAYYTFFADFESHIRDYCKDDNVVGFKSIACYRTGLDIVPYEPTKSPLAPFGELLASILKENNGKRVRLATKEVNDGIVCLALAIAGEYGKPVQFHTGLGDNDLNWSKANPALMQPVIKAFPKTTFVILHSSYPFTQEAGYLTSVYKNVYLDFGEIFPFVSAEGQRQVIKQLFELCPTNKILWSTDGHYWPETYYLGTIQAREALFSVLSDLVLKGDLTEPEAIEIVKLSLFYNSNKLYGLNLTPDLSWQENVNSNVPNTLIGLSLLDSLPPSITHIRLQWVDYINAVRYRVIPIQRFRSSLSTWTKGGLTITKALFFLSEGDAIVEGGSPVGEWLYVPDLTSLRVCGYATGHASVMGYFEGKDGSKCDLCPRGLLRDVLKKAKESHGVEFLVGYETEFILVPKQGERNPHEWCNSNATLAGSTECQILAAIEEALKQSNIEVMYWHAESAPGQYEVITGPLPPLEAADALITVRETVRNVANTFGMHATLSPKVDENAAGNGAHVHISLQTASRMPSKPQSAAPKDLSVSEVSFLQGLLDHLPAVSTFTLPQPCSYERMVDGAWSGGTWVAWGTDNRECPIRLCGQPNARNFELKALDATANPYLAMSAIISAGMLGIAHQSELKIKDCTKAAALMTSAERVDRGLTTRMPNSPESAQKSLWEDEDMVHAIGGRLIEAFTSVNQHLGNRLKPSGSLDFSSAVAEKRKLSQKLMQRY